MTSSNASSINSTITVSNASIEKLLENVLIGKTSIMSGHVLDAIATGSKVNDKSLSSTCATLNLNDLNLLSSKSAANKKKDLTTFDDEDCSVIVDDDTDTIFEDNSTRMVTPTDEVGVSEQYLNAQRILQQAGVPPPDFSQLTPKLEEAFTVSTAHLAQIIGKNCDDLYTKLEAVFAQKSNQMEVLMAQMKVQLETANKLNKAILESRENAVAVAKETPVVKETVAKAAEAVVRQKRDWGTMTMTETPVRPPAKQYDVIANFELFLTRSKMATDEVSKHGLAVSKMIGHDATEYMGKFGYLPKYKKK